MKAVFSLILLCLFVGCCNPKTDKEYFTLEEAFKNPQAVTKLDLGDYRFRSETDRYFTLDSTIQQFLNLEELSFTCNHIEILPSEITQLKKLKRVTIVDADNMSAPINNCALDLADTFIKLSKIKSLETLYLPYIRSELPPEIRYLTNIKSLQLVFNSLSTLPPEISELKNLRHLYVPYNNLKQLPSSFGEMDSLVSITLHTNSFQEIPPEVFQLKQLAQLDLGNNHITEVSDELSTLNNLTSLDLGFNSIEVIPKSVLKLSKLETVDFSHNSISVIPSEISSLSALKRLDLSENHINLIPKSLMEIESLEVLNLGTNSIEIIPQAIENLKFLTQADFSGNHISEIPMSLFALTDLEELNLSSNVISSIPTDEINLNKLRTLNFTDNSITEIPVSLFKIQTLESLLLSFNNISEVPNEIFTLKNLEQITLFGNPYSEDKILAQIKERYPWFSFLKLLFYVIPLIIGVVCVLIGIRIKNKVTSEERIYYCFLMAFISLIICSLSSWKLPFLLHDLFKVEYLYPKIFLEQWLYSWIPIVIAIITNVILIAIAVKTYYESKNKINKESSSNYKALNKL